MMKLRSVKKPLYEVGTTMIKTLCLKITLLCPGCRTVCARDTPQVESYQYYYIVWRSRTVGQNSQKSAKYS